MYNKVSMEVILTDGAVTLRPYEKKNIPDLYKAVWESMKEMSAWLPFAHENYSPLESRAWVKQRPKQWKNGDAYDFAIFDAKDGSYMGGCGLNGIGKDNRHANLGYWVRSSRTGHGTAPAAARLLAGWGFQTLGLKRIEIVVAVENRRSQRVAEKVGAKREGVERNRIMLRDKPVDAVMFSLIPGEV